MSAMELFIGIVGALIVGAFIFWGFSLYNRLIKLRENCEKAWSNIDVLLKQRSDELPKLIDTAKEYMDYEQETFQQVVEARQQVQEASSPKEEAEADSMLTSALGDFFALAEDYPDLKANENFMQLQDRISEIEDKIADRREYYNSATTEYNARIQQLPYVFIANGMGWERRELFEATEEEKEDIDINEMFNGGP